MTKSSELAAAPSEDALAEEHEKAFQKIYDQLDAFAVALAGKKWTNDKVFEVEASRTIRRPTTKFGIADDEDYFIKTVEFTANKVPSGDPGYPYLNVFQIAETVSAPIAIEEVDSDHHARLIDYFLENFPELMRDCLHTMAIDEGDVMTEDGDIDLDNIDSSVAIDVCEQVLMEVGVPMQLGRTILYTVSEGGNSLEYIEKYTYEVGLGTLTLAEFDSTARYGRRVAVHGRYVDEGPDEYTITPQDETLIPDREKMPEQDTGERILAESAFYKMVEGVFGDEDHAGKPYLEHIKSIKRIVRKLTKVR